MGNRRSRSALFLMEQLIVVAVFALCAEACVRILTASYFMATETRDLSNALRTAESAAECYKAVSGDIGKLAEVLGGSEGYDGTGAAIIYYDNDWLVCDANDAMFMLRVVGGLPNAGLPTLLSGDLTIEKVTEEPSETIVALKLAANTSG